PLAAAAGNAGATGSERDRPALRRRRSAFARFRRLLSRLRGRVWGRAALAAEPRAAPDRRGGVAGAQGRTRPARGTARGGARRCLWSGQSRARGPTAGGRYSGQSGIPAAPGRGRARRRGASAGLLPRPPALPPVPLV